MRKIIITSVLIMCIFFLGFYITFNKKPNETTFELNKRNGIYTIRIHDDLDTKYFNQKITVNTNLFVKDNEIYVEEDDYNKSDKISNIMFIESYDRTVILEKSICITSIDDENKIIKVYATFSLQYPYSIYKKRELFTTLYTFEYDLNNNEILLKMIDESEWSEY